MTRRRNVLLVAGALAVAGPSLAAPTPVISLPPSLEAALASGHFTGTPLGFRMMALSFVADSCAAEGTRHPERSAAAQRCIARAFHQATLLRRANPSLRDSGLWLTHLNLILGAAHRVGPCLDERQHAQISRTLRARSLADPTAHAASFSNTSLRWPADQSATLASLVRFDRAHGTHLADEPVAKWRDLITRRATRGDLGLPWSEVTGKSRHSRQPRGCALAYETLYLREFDAPLALRYWGQFKKHYFVERLALVGFREWPPGMEGASDSDSGPIVRGVGTAATAFAIAAARVMGDGVLAARLTATASLVEQAARLDPNLSRVAHSTLADAIRRLGQS